MVVDDLVACGAEPLFLLDYIACGEVVPDKVAEIGAGIADGCRYAGCALLGGETAEHPGVLRPDEYDVSATGVGVVEESEILGRDRVEVGDAVIAMRSSGLHSNGYSLVRHVLLGAGRMRLDTVVEDFGHQRTLGEELLTPTKIYAKDCLEPDRGDRRARVRPRHRRRHPRQPGPRSCPSTSTRWSTARPGGRSRSST